MKEQDSKILQKTHPFNNLVKDNTPIDKDFNSVDQQQFIDNNLEKYAVNSQERSDWL